MKKHIFTTLILCTFLSLTALAQTEQGTKLVGGNASIRFNDPFTINLSPDFGIFVANHIAVGGMAQVYYISTDNGHTTALGLSPFFRYYFGKDNPTRFFAQVNTGLTHYWYSSDFGGREYKSSYNSTNVGLGLGLVHFLTEQVGLEAVLAYNYNAYSNSSNSNAGAVTLNVGFQIYLPSKTK